MIKSFLLGLRGGSSLAIIVACALTAPPAFAQCRAICNPDEVLRDGCCVQREGAPPVYLPPDEANTACKPGQVHLTDSTYCCWPGQVWGGNRCRGIPSECPSGFHVDEVKEDCVITACGEGRVRAADGLTCCWPDQVVAGGACRGRPSRCPAGLEIRGEDCFDPVAAAAAAVAAAKAAEEADKVAKAEARLQAKKDADVLAEQRRAERKQHFGEAYAENNHWFNLNSYDFVGLGEARSSVAKFTDNPLRFMQGISIELRRSVPFLFTDGKMPIIGLDFAAHGDLLFGFNGATLVNTELSTDFGLRLWYFIPLFSFQFDWLFVQLSNPKQSGPATNASYFPITLGPGLAVGNYGQGRRAVGWSLEARWLPALDAAFDTYDLRAQVTFNVIGLSAFFRRSSHMGAVNNLICGGLGIGVNFARF